MHRADAVISGVVLTVAVASGCGGVVPLTQTHHDPQLDTVNVQVIDARSMTRAQIESVLNEHEMIARFDVRIPSGADYESSLAEELEKGRSKVLRAGGKVLMYTDDSELIAIIVQDARYAGAPGVVTMYVMLPRGAR